MTATLQKINHKVKRRHAVNRNIKTVALITFENINFNSYPGVRPESSDVDAACFCMRKNAMNKAAKQLLYPMIFHNFICTRKLNIHGMAWLILVSRASAHSRVYYNNYCYGHRIHTKQDGLAGYKDVMNLLIIKVQLLPSCSFGF